VWPALVEDIDGEDGYEDPAMDEGGHSDAESACAREDNVIARKLKRSLGATRQKAMALGVTLGTSRKKKKA
jgi:hypothetical protein